jgi:acyl-CoA synthetase (AMP-forming)/AMP-acid ligase II
VDSNHLAHRFAAIAGARPDAPCLVEGPTRLTWQEVAERADALARGLRGAGLQPGDRLAVDLPNGSAWVIALLAAAQSGLTVVPMDPGLGYHELQYQLRHAEVAGAVIPEVGGAFDYLELFDELLPTLPSLQLVTYVGPGTAWFDDRGVPFEELLARGRRQPPLVPPPADAAPLALVYTAGTMGKPKGVLQSHAGLVGCALATVGQLDLGADEVFVLAVPLSHILGLSALVAALAHGATIVLVPRFESGAVLAAMAREGVTFLPGTPTMFELLMRDPAFATTALGSLRRGIIAGGTVGLELADRIRRWCDVEIVYGLTEGGPAVAMTRRSDPPDKRRNTVGLPLPGVEARVVDVRTGELHAGESLGELAIRTPHVMLGYHRMPNETARVLAHEGYLLTGDLAAIDDEGYLTMVARRKDVIMRAGQAVTPREIEDMLRTHPGVEDACVLGVPHDVMGELICACVVLVEGAVVTGPELRRFCQDLLSSTKVPDLIRFFDSFPLSPSGQVRRQELSRVVAM